METDYNLMQETMESAHDYLGNVLAGIGEISRSIQSGREDKALTLCVDVIDGMQWLLEAVRLTRPLQEQRGVLIDPEPLKGYLVQVVEVLENRDYVALSDIFEYELTDFFAGWRDKIGQIVEG